MREIKEQANKIAADAGSTAKEGWIWVDGGIAFPRGFFATGVQAAIKYPDKFDLALVWSDVPAQAAGVYTRNQVKAHPLLLTRQHLTDGVAQAIVANSGNANACVGQPGDQAALAMATAAGRALCIPAQDVIVASTGIIGVELPVDRVLKGIAQAAAKLRQDPESAGGSASSHEAALAIMTTDTRVKEYACELATDQGTIRLGAMAKGSGMIHPNMGTMLGFLTTDASLSAGQLQLLLSEAVEESFNMVTVDGDTSTNDMVTVLANGRSGIVPQGEDLDRFQAMFRAVCIRLAQDIARDGEGATKYIAVQVDGARSISDARLIAKAVAGSSLVKTAVFGEDANWGRILAAAGYSGAAFDPAGVDIFLGPVQVAAGGQGIDFSEAEAKAVLSGSDIPIRLNLKAGTATATAWGCDLTHDYVTINGDYRT